MTEKLYLNDEYLKEFNAKIVDIKKVENDNYEVILDKTAFYPEKGGQPCDLGFINNSKVLDVFERNEDVIHIVSTEIMDKEVKCKIDWDRRFENMQQHAGQHLLAAAFLNSIDGYTVSMHIGSEFNTIDVELADISLDDVIKAELLANKIIYENRNIKKFIVDKEEVERLPLRKKPKVDSNIRIVEIENFDMSPCGGTHVKSTGEIGIIKILKYEKYKKMTRIEFVCGVRALRDYENKNSAIYEIGRKLSSKPENIVDSVIKLEEDKKKLEIELRKKEELLLTYEAEKMAANAKKVKCNMIVKTFEDRTLDQVRFLGEKLSADYKMITVFGIKGEKNVILVNKFDEVQIDMAKELRNLGVKGGGKGNSFQGVVDNFEVMDKIPKIFIQET